MRWAMIILAMLVSSTVLCQTNLQIIGRNVGTKTLDNGQEIRVFGFTQSLLDNPNVPGPTLHFEEGDSIIIDFWNVSQGAPHTIHLHGLDVNQANDGVPHLSFEVHHMDHGYYRFRAPHPGTYLYHCHVVSSIHVQAGMYGLIVVHPKQATLETWTGGHPYDEEGSLLFSEIDTIWHHDSVLLHEYDTTQAHNHVPLPKYRPQHFVVNGLSGQQLADEAPIAMGKNGSYYLRLANIGYHYNEVVFPAGITATAVSSDGRPLPQSKVLDTLWIFPGERYGVLLSADIDLVDIIQVRYMNMNNDQQEGSAEVAIEVQGFYGLKSDPSSTQIKVFPNPATTNVQLSASENTFPIQIVNALGQIVHTVPSPSFTTIDVQQWPTGWYGLVASRGDTELIGSFVIQR